MTPSRLFVLLVTLALVVGPVAPVVGHVGFTTAHVGDAGVPAAVGPTSDAALGGPATASVAAQTDDTDTVADIAARLPPVSAGVFDRAGAATLSSTFSSDRPLSFVENAGQFDDSVAYAVRGSGRSASFTADGVVFASGQGENRTIVTMAFVGGDGSQIEGVTPSPGVMNYFRGSNPDGWYTGVSTYEGVAYRDLSPGVDLIFGGSDGVLKSEYVLAPGASPEAIGVRYDGADSVSIAADGSLVVETGDGSPPLVEAPPVAYQTIDGERVDVPVSFTLTDGVVGFDVGAYDATRPLVVDPTFDYYVPTFSTLLGGEGDNAGYDVHVADDGTVTVVGYTFLGDIPTTEASISDSYEAQSAFDTEAFVVRYDRFGNVIYGTYLGGSGEDVALTVGVDAAGAVYVAGSTQSGDFPIAAATGSTGLGSSYAGNSDGFLAKIRPDGTALTYSGYVGGSEFDKIRDIDVTALGTVHFVGETRSPDLPVPSDAYITDINRGNGGAVLGILPADGFYGRVDIDDVLRTLTYYGGTERDTLSGVAVGPGGVYLTGTSFSPDFPVTLNALQPSPAPAQFLVDAVVVELDAAGQPTYSSYLGGAGQDEAFDIAADATGRVYLVGLTGSTDFPTTASAFQPTDLPGFDVFVTAFDFGQGPSPTRAYSTYLGGTDFDHGTGITVVESGIVAVTGEATQDLTTVNAYQPTFGGTSFENTLFFSRRVIWDAFYATIDTTQSGADSLRVSSYLGGDDGDIGLAIDANANGVIAVTGVTFSADYPVRVNDLSAEAPIYAGFGDAFVTVLAPTLCRTDPDGNGNPDNDGDGLCDEWELNGVDIDGDGTVDLPIHEAPYNADPNRKDIFVEIDYMSCAVSKPAGLNDPDECGPEDAPDFWAGGDYTAHDHDPQEDFLRFGLPAVEQAFAEAPVENPDGTLGITIHLMVDEAVPEVSPLRFGSDSSEDTSFKELKWDVDTGVACTGYFGTTSERDQSDCETIRDARHQVFRYAIVGHYWQDPVGRPEPRLQGIAELPGDDFLVAKGFEWYEAAADRERTWNPDATTEEIERSQSAVFATTFMHELGHALSLRHGGIDHTNRKPNYLGIMNYGVAHDDVGVVGVAVLPALWETPFVVENTKFESTYGPDTYVVDEANRVITVTETIPDGSGGTVEKTSELRLVQATDGSGTPVTGLYVVESDDPLVIKHPVGSRLDYSSVQIPSLDESALDETSGLSAFLADWDYTVYYETDVRSFDVTEGGGVYHFLDPGETVDIKVKFEPIVTETQSAVLVIQSTDVADGDALIPLVGDGVGRPPEGGLSLSTDGLLFDEVAQGASKTETFTVFNTGDGDLRVTSITLSGLHPGDFRVTSGDAPFTLAPAGSRDVTVEFTPSVAGDRRAKLRVRADDPEIPRLDIGLYGTDEAVSGPDLVTSTTRIDYQSIPVGDAIGRTLTIANAGTEPMVVSVELNDRPEARIGVVGEPIDWDNDGTIETATAANINADEDVETLPGHDDWNNILYSARTTRDFGRDVAVSPAVFDFELGGEPTLDDYLEDAFPSLDVDGDGVDNEFDVCLTVYNPDQADGDGDGIGDACEPSTTIVVGTTTPEVGVPVTFSVTPVSPEFDYVWQFGDGATATGTSVTHTYGQPGPYTVTLDVATGFVREDREQTTLSVTGVGSPELDASLATTANTVGAPVQVIANATGVGGNVATLTLARADGTVLDSVTCGTLTCDAVLSYTPTTSTWTGSGYASQTLFVNATSETGLTTTIVLGTEVAIAGDANADGVVDIEDAAVVGLAFGSSSGDPAYTDAADLTNDGSVDDADVTVLQAEWKAEAT